MKELVLSGKRKDAAEDWMEEIEKVKAMATRDGFHSFRVAEIDLSSIPDFSRTVNMRTK